LGGIDWLFGAVLAGLLLCGVCRGLLVESLAFFGLLAPTGRGARQPAQPILPAGLLAGRKAPGRERGVLELRDPAPTDPPGWVPVPRVRPA
jgi:hypothetical protein